MHKTLDRDEIDPYRYDELIEPWLEDTGVELPEDLGDEYTGVAVVDLPPDLLAEFTDWLEVHHADADEPNFGDPAVSFSHAELVKPLTWLVHFTEIDSARDIVQRGFTAGADDEHVHYSKATTHPESGAWVFAFDALSADALNHAFKQHYGDHAVMFRSSAALQAYHLGDDENQVLVNRFDVPVRDRVLLWRTEANDWAVGPSQHPYCVGDYGVVADWVAQHYDQYRREFQRLMRDRG